MHEIVSDTRSTMPMLAKAYPRVWGAPDDGLTPCMAGAPRTGWRCKPATPCDMAQAPRIIAVRWRSIEEQPLEAQAQTPDDSYLLCIALRRMDVRLSVSGRVMRDGVVTPGTLHVTEPGVAAKCLFRGAYDALHLHIDNALIDECVTAERDDHDGLPSEGALSHDPVIEQLGRTLLASDQLGRMFGPIYADSVGTAIVSRLLALRARVGGGEKRRVAGLVKWRLRRVLDFIDAHMDEAIRLADLATAAGLTPMHFAAQFRGATGLRPHEYLLRRRVERAQELLHKNLPTVDVALAVGFQSQAHFTSVFKRYVGQPPQAWRRMTAP
jgi:AraC family transcriptional regulator